MRTTKIAIITLGLLACVGAIESAGAFATLNHSVRRSAQDVSIQMKALPTDDSKRCGVDLFYPVLKNSFNQEFKPECTGSYRADNGAGLVLNYAVGPGTEEPVASIDINVISTGINEFVRSSNHHHSGVLQDVDGILRPLLNTGPYDSCQDLLRTTITPISGYNWRGWTIENVYEINKKKKAACRTDAVNYRCVSFVIGNGTVSAEFGGACFPRQQAIGFEKRMSYDLFLEMVKSIRFSER